MPPQPPTTSQPNPPAARSWLKDISPHSFAAIVLVLGVIVAAAIGAFFWHNHKTAPTGPLAYKYSRLDSYTLKGSQGNDALSFSKPVQLTSFQGAQDQQVVFAQFDTKNPIIDIADIYATSVYSLAVSSASAKAAFGQTIKTDNSQSNYLQRFVKQWLGSNYMPSFGSITTFTNPSTKNYAWALNFDATVKPQTKQSTTYPPLSGRAVVALGAKTVYYFMIDAVNYNWQNNQTVWQQVFNSLKIDQ